MRIKTVEGLGLLVRNQRKKKEWSQAELARRAEVSRLWIGDLEKGKPTLEIHLVLRTLRELGIALNAGLVSPSSLEEIL